MNENTLILMIGNLSRSLLPVINLLAGGAYLIGLVFFWLALGKLKKIGDARMNSSSQEKIFVPIAYILAGSFLFFLPSGIITLSNTAFGTSNPLKYANYNPYDIYNSMGLVIQVAGLIWCLRGAVLLAHASEPGVKHGTKGLAFLCAGIFAINFDNTVLFLDWVMDQLASFNISVKKTNS